MTSQAYLSQLFALDGRVAVVTGGSSGIGRAIAGAIARAGASVVVVARNRDNLASTVGELEAHGGRAAWVSGDLSTREGVRTVADEVVGAFGEPDILVNCVGVNLRAPMNEVCEGVFQGRVGVAGPLTS